MRTFLIRRFFGIVLVVWGVSVVIFWMMHSVPGGPFDQRKRLPAQVMKNLNAHYALDQPLPVQYLAYVRAILVPQLVDHPVPPSLRDDYLIQAQVGDKQLLWMNFGPSYAARGRSVASIFREQFPVSAQLGVMALLLAVTIGVPLGVLAALKQNSLWDFLGLSIAILGVSVPVIVSGPVLVWLFGVELRWFPPTGWGAGPPFRLGLFPAALNREFFLHAALPVFSLGIGESALIARLTRASLLEVLHEDFVRTARGKGVPYQLVILRHALPHTLIPVVTVLGPTFAALVTGTFAVELIFGIPGLGRYFVTSIFNRDYPVIMGTGLLYAVLLTLANLMVDILYVILDPRIRTNQ